MIRFVTAFIAALLVVLLSACESEPAPVTEGATPAPPAVPEQQAPAELSTEQLVVPIPPGDAGVVHGILLSQAEQEPFDEGLDLFLAEVLRSEDGQPAMAGLDRQRSPRATKDTQGTFVFPDVEPGHYAVIAVSPINELMVPDPSNPDQGLQVVVEPGQSYDLGTIVLDIVY
jgi:hypothetical protein